MDGTDEPATGQPEKGDVSAVNHDKDHTAFEEAMEAANLGIMEEILESNPAVNTRIYGKFKTPSLHFAIGCKSLSESDRLSMAKLLLSRNADPNGHSDTGSWFRPLHVACGHGLTSVAEYLISKGADVHGRNHVNNTAVASCLKSNQPAKMVNILLQHKYDPNTKNTKGWSALHLAAERPYDKMFDTIRLLLKQKDILVDARNDENNTPLRIALGNDQPETMKLLLSNNADVNAEIWQGNTVLHFACKGPDSGNISISREIMDILLAQRNVTLDAKNNLGNAPLHIAVMRKNVAAVRAMLTRGADPNLIGAKGWTPLHYACAKPFTEMQEILDLLLSFSRVQVTSRALANGDGETPLHIACRWGYFLTVQRLLEVGADINAKVGSDDWKPIHRAAYWGHLECVEELLWSGANHSDTTKSLSTAETLARDKGHDHIVERLQNYDLLAHFEATGKIKEINSPSANQEDICKTSSGFIWPPLGTRKLDYTFWDMIYAQESLASRIKDAARARWIHLPANNKTWVEDVFKAMYGGTENEEDGKALSKIIMFINKEFNEMGQQTSRFRQPHYEFTQGPRPRPQESRMMSIVLPILDVDMQQPFFYQSPYDDDGTRRLGEGDGVEDEVESLVVKYTTDEGRDLTVTQEAHISRMKSLNTHYPETHKVRTLDESFHELLEPKEVLRRNGDQVLSRHIARSRVKFEQNSELSSDLPGTNTSEKVLGSGKRLLIDKESKGGGGSDAPETAEDALGDTTRGIIRRETVTVETEQEGENDGSDGEGTAKFGKGENTSTRQILQHSTVQSQIEMTPSRLEMQKRQTSEEGAKRRSDLFEIFGFPDRKGKPTQFLRRLMQGPDFRYMSDDEVPSKHSSSSVRHRRVKPNTRQQVLVVPQLWIWKVEDFVITAYPERWDLSNPRTLLQVILSKFKEKGSMNAEQGVLTETHAEDIVKGIVETCLEYQPLFPAFGGRHSHHDAFSAEIAHVSGHTTECYEDYQRSIGKTAESFSEAIRKETKYLVMIDDILNELAMIKRVQEDQTIIDTFMQKDPVLYPPKPRDGGGQRRRGLFFLRSQRTDMRKLDRHIQEAERVRQSIITLLDLRQRQASTENAINTGRQSKLLFEQSKVLFIFTGATVIFAPLSWVATLMDLNISSFTPDAWDRGQAASASMGSIVGTIVLCFVGLKAYEYFYTQNVMSSHTDLGSTDARKRRATHRPHVHKG